MPFERGSIVEKSHRIGKKCIGYFMRPNERFDFAEKLSVIAARMAQERIALVLWLLDRGQKTLLDRIPACVAHGWRALPRNATEARKCGIGFNGDDYAGKSNAAYLHKVRSEPRNGAMNDDV